MSLPRLQLLLLHLQLLLLLLLHHLPPVRPQQQHCTSTRLERITSCHSRKMLSFRTW